MTRKSLTQKEKCLIMLKGAGSKGCTLHDFLQENVTRAAAEVKKLRDEGVEIENLAPKGQPAHYRLVGTAAGGDDHRKDGLLEPPVEASRHSSQLFELEAPKQSQFASQAEWDSEAA